MLEVPVEYERTPPSCTKCKCFGHIASQCPVTFKEVWIEKKVSNATVELNGPDLAAAISGENGGGMRDTVLPEKPVSLPSEVVHVTVGDNTEQTDSDLFAETHKDSNIQMSGSSSDIAEGAIPEMVGEQLKSQGNSARTPVIADLQ